MHKIHTEIVITLVWHWPEDEKRKERKFKGGKRPFIIKVINISVGECRQMKITAFCRNYMIVFLKTRICVVPFSASSLVMDAAYRVFFSPISITGPSPHGFSFLLHLSIPPLNGAKVPAPSTLSPCTWMEEGRSTHPTPIRYTGPPSFHHSHAWGWKIDKHKQND